MTNKYEPVLRTGEEEDVGLSKKDGPAEAHYQRREELADKILMYLRNGFWVIVAAIVIYYSNFFHHLFRNPNVNELFFQITVAGYTFLVALMLFASIIMPRIAGTSDIEEYNPKLVPIGAVVGFVSVISLIIAIWPVWGWWSLLIFISIWKGFFGLSVFLPGGDIGNTLFLLINAGTVLSFYFIEHEGYFH
jgi:uncharacterized membrane protein HdeD (DUF308 family)